MNQRSTTGMAGIRTVAVPVSDADRALDFYVGKLGFEKRMDAQFGEGLRWVEVAPAGAAVTIALAPAQPGHSGGIDTGIRLSTPDAAADHERMRSLGADVDSELMRFPGVPAMFSFRDVDGNQLYVVEGA